MYIFTLIYLFIPLTHFVSSYYDQMCGLCGDYDGNPNNDFTKPDGSQTDSSNQFGDSWKTDEDEDATSVTLTLLHNQTVLLGLS